MIKPLKSEIIDRYIRKRGTLTQPIVVFFDKGKVRVSKFVVLGYVLLYLCYAMTLVREHTDHLEEFRLDAGFYNTMIYKKYSNLVIQMTKIHFSHTFGLHPQFLAHSYPNPWKFLSDKNNRNIFH